jgi:hypothetical protein
VSAKYRSGGDGWLQVGDDMSVDIAIALREEASRAREVAERMSRTDDKKALAQLAARLVEIAERLERDARD